MGCEASQGVQTTGGGSKPGTEASVDGSCDKQTCAASDAADHGVCDAAEHGVCDAQGEMFTELQTDCIRSTWPLVATDSISYGSTIFMDIFTEEPCIKQLFHFSALTDSEVLHDASFITHVTRYMNCLAAVCETLEALHEPDNAATSELLLLGAAHARIPGFRCGHFHVFIKCTHFTWQRVLRDEYTAEVRDAWAALFHFVVQQLQRGFIIYTTEDEKQHNPVDT